MKKFTFLKSLFVAFLLGCTALLSAADYVKVTTAPTDWSGTYLIVSEDGNVALTDAVDAANNGTAVTIVNGTITTDANIAFTIAAIEGGYSIKAPNGKYIGSTAANSNELKIATTAYTNTISIENGSAKIVGTSSVLRFNSASDQLRFRYFKASTYASQKPVQLYKLVETPVTSSEVTTMAELKANEGKRVLYKGLEPMKVTVGEGFMSYTEYFMPDSATVLSYLGNVIPAKMDVYGTYNSAYVADEWSEATPTFVVDSVAAIYAFNNMGDLVNFVSCEATEAQKAVSYEVKESVVVTLSSMFSFYVQYETKQMWGGAAWTGLMVQSGRLSTLQTKAGDAVQLKGTYTPATYDENYVMISPAFFALETGTVVSENNKLNYATIDLSNGLKSASNYYASFGRLSKGGKIVEDDYGYYYVVSYIDYVENPVTNMYDEVFVTDSLQLMEAGPVDLTKYVGKELDLLVVGVLDYDVYSAAPIFYVTELQEPKIYYNTIAELLAAGAQTDYAMSSVLRNPVLLTYVSYNEWAGYTIFVQDTTGAIAIKGLGVVNEDGSGYTFPYDVVAGDSIIGVEGFTAYGELAAFMWSGSEYVSTLKLEKVSEGVVEPIDITLAEFNADVALVSEAVMSGDFYLSKYANKVVRVKGLTRTDDPEDEKWPWLVQGEDTIKVSTYYWGKISVPYAINSLTGIADYAIINGQIASIQPLNAESVVTGSGVKVEYVTLTDLYTENGLIVTDGEFQIFTITGQNVTDMNGNLPSGVYVVRTANAIGKVVVK